MIVEAEHKIQYVSPKVTSYKFTDTLLDKKLIFQIVKFDGTDLIYINDMEQPYCNRLDMAMLTRFSNNPIVTSLMGPLAEHPGVNIAGRLSKKLGKTVYLSLNLANERNFISTVEKRLLQEIDRQPNQF